MFIEFLILQSSVVKFHRTKSSGVGGLAYLGNQVGGRLCRASGCFRDPSTESLAG